MSKKINNIWIFCHYAQQPPYNTMLRYHNWGKELVDRGYKVTIVAASTVHNTYIDVTEEINSDSDICCGISYLYLHTHVHEPQTPYVCLFRKNKDLIRTYLKPPL